jgi:rhodanese-related sulfurtransferase
VHPLRTLLIAGAVAVMFTVAGCAGDGGGEPPAGNETGTDTAASPVLADPEAFARRIEAPGVVAINVHIPNEGSIAGTDLTIPFDQIAESSELPDDLGTPLAIYCRSGNMSADAIDDLVALGYTDIVELDGGFNAWEASGRVVDRTMAD